MLGHVWEVRTTQGSKMMKKIRESKNKVVGYVKECKLGPVLILLTFIIQEMLMHDH